VSGRGYSLHIPYFFHIQISTQSTNINIMDLLEASKFIFLIVATISLIVLTIMIVRILLDVKRFTTGLRDVSANVNTVTDNIKNDYTTAKNTFTNPIEAIITVAINSGILAKVASTVLKKVKK
jgi:uncharacterized membrane protein